MRPVHLVLDTSAVLAYACGSEHVGEPLTQVAENDATFVVPLTVLAAGATQTTTPTTRTRTRTGHPGCTGRRRPAGGAGYTNGWCTRTGRPLSGRRRRVP
jgi:hypothetical protein